MTARLGGFGRAAAIAGLIALAGCTVAPPPPTPGVLAVSPVPAARPEPPAAPPSEIARYFERLENDRVARGLMRRDGGGPDTPFTDAMLEENFVRIALYDEYSAGLVQRAQAAALRRFAVPVRIAVEFGADFSPARQAVERNRIGGYADRLGRVSRHPVGVAFPGETANFFVFVLSEDERRAFGPRLSELIPGLSSRDAALVTDLPLTVSCLVIAVGGGVGGGTSRAVAIVRAELPDLSRTACYHEEIAQGLGLANDHPQARPSIFNDTQEFALLTTHDELLLRILYDPRLRIGMREAEARPIVRRIVAELMDRQS